MNDKLKHNIKTEMVQLLDLVQTTNLNANELGNTTSLIEQLKATNFSSCGSKSTVEVTSLLSEICWNYNSLRSLFHGKKDAFKSFQCCYLELLSLRNKLK